MAKRSHPVDPVKIAKRLEQIRVAVGEITQAEFARRIGETPQKVNNWFKALHVPPADAVLKIEDCYDYRARWVVYGELPEKRPTGTHRELIRTIETLPDRALPAVQDIVRLLTEPTSRPS